MGRTRVGRVEVISGPMFAGKTEELLRRVRRAQVGGRDVEVLSHELDTRRGAGTVSTHSGLSIASRTVADAAEIEQVVAARPSLDLLAVDEGHFYGPDLLGAVMRVADRGLLVVVAGLDVTFDARPFEPMASVAALADSADRLTAVCSACGADAPFHERLSMPTADPRATTAEHVGGAEAYRAVCRDHLAGPWWRAAEEAA
jgi:thymidine kinase